MSGMLPSLETPGISTLAALRQWVVWATVERDGKPTKVPFNPKTGGMAKVSLPSTWGTYQEAMQAWQSSAKYSGVGFVLSKTDPFVFVDLDKCIDDDGKTETWASDIIQTLDSWTEISPSGKGYHVIVRGTLSGGRNRKGQFEVYESGRYFTITGDTVGDRDSIEERQEPLNKVLVSIFEPQTPVAPVGDEGSKASPSPPIQGDKLAEMSAQIRPLLDGGAEPPTDKLDRLFEVADVIQRTWTRKRPEKKCQDWSASEWDQSLTSQLVNSGWPLDDVIPTLIAFRRRHGEVPKLRDDYYARTVLTALNDREYDDAILGLEPESTEGLTPDETRQKIVDGLGKVLKVPIIKVIELPSTPRKEYQIVTGRGKIIGEINMLTDHGVFKRAMAETTGVVIKRFKPHVWDNVAQRLLDMRELGDVAEEATEHGQVRTWLEGFIIRSKPRKDFDVDAVELGEPFFNSSNLYIQLAPFVEHIKKYHGIVVTPKRMSNMLRELGALAVQRRFEDIQGRFKQRRVYRLPTEFADLAKGLPEK